ncbi:MAG: amino acid ABC transporter permease [Ardenticatenaceae bacterium]|nr:amino acid ABC transporter permease [Ardenticatenaceae bacterium]
MTAYDDPNIGPGRSRLAPALDRLADLPWWLLVTIGLGVYVVIGIMTNETTNQAFWFIVGQDPEALKMWEIAREGLVMTLYVTFLAYLLALLLGMIIGLGRVSENRLYYNLATFYVEIVRGIPMLVLLMAIAFVGVPAIVGGINNLGEWLVGLGLEGIGGTLAGLTTRNISNTGRVIIGLGVAYGAFSAEIFRAGIQSVERGQMEAARALGMSYFQAMRLIILPQAIRRVLPALGNDFVAMLKDSSLVSVLGVRDITQLNKLYTASTFNFVQGYTVLTFLYLTMTILLTRLVRWMEARMRRSQAT